MDYTTVSYSKSKSVGTLGKLKKRPPNCYSPRCALPRYDPVGALLCSLIRLTASENYLRITKNITRIGFKDFSMKENYKTQHTFLFIFSSCKKQLDSLNVIESRVFIKQNRPLGNALFMSFSTRKIQNV